MKRSLRRRTLLQAAIAAMAAPMTAGRSFAQSQQVTISSWGGSFQEALRKVLFEPFTQETGIKVVELTWGGQGLARLKAQLQAGQVEIDLLDGPPFWSALGRQQELLQPIDPAIFADRDSHIASAIGEFAYAYGSTTWGLTYNSKAFPAGGPSGWKDFWDVDRVKGRRALFGATPARHLEYALLADGVPVGEVNPLNEEKIDRAFKKLGEIKPKLALWYQTTSQVESLLATGEVDCGELTSGRTFFLQSQGAPLQFVFDGAVMNLLIWVMAKNAPNKANAERLLAFCSRADRQAELAKVLFSGPTNKKTFALLTDESLSHRLPTFTGNYARQVALDSDWWAGNLDKLSGRWNKLTSG